MMNEVPVQINGKTKSRSSAQRLQKKRRLQQEKEAIADKLTGNIVKEIYVPKKRMRLYEIIEKKFSQQNKVLGNIEKFA